MADESNSGKQLPTEERMRAEVARKAERRRKAAREQNRNIWSSLGLFGLIGWSIAIPALLGVALGIWIDRHWPSRVSWTLTLLLIGVAAGCVNAWHWIKQESPNE